MSPSVRVLYFLLLSLSLLGAWFGVHELLQVPLGNLRGLVMVGAGMLILAWVIANPPKSVNSIDTNSMQGKISRRLDPFVQAVLDRPVLYLGVVVGAIAVILASNPAFQPWPILTIWAVSILLFLIGSAAWERRISIRRIVSQVVEWARTSKWELLAVLALTVLAFLCRSIALDHIPHNIHGDEGEMGLQARAVIQGKLRDPFTTTFLSHATLWFFMQALALRLFGNTIVGLRMLSAVIGTMAVPALYMFARPLYGRAVAIIATALLAFYHFHIHFSRIGLNNIADPLMILVALLAFFNGYHKRSMLSFALAGVLMGLAQYLYFGARFIIVMMAALTGYLLIKERHQLQNFLGHIALMGTGFILTLGPLLRHYIAHPDTYFARLAEHGLLQRGYLPDLQANGQSLLTALAGHAYRTFGFFVAVNEHGPFYDSGIPILSHGMELLFIIGIVLTLLGWRNIEKLALLLWVAGTALFGGFLLFDPPQSQRYLIAAPALCILMALALVQIGILLNQIMGLSERRWIGFTTFIVLTIALWNIYFYFDIYTPLNSYAYNPTMTEIGNYLHTQAEGRYAYMFTAPITSLNYATIQFLANDPAGIDVIDPLTSVTALQEPPPGLRPVFIFIPERLSELEVIKERYPSGRLQEYSLPPNTEKILLYIYEPH